MDKSAIPEIRLDITQTPNEPTIEVKKKSSLGKKLAKILLIFLVFVMVLTGAVGAFGYFAVYLPAMKVVDSAKLVQSSGKEVYTHLKEQDLAKSVESLDVTKKNLEDAKKKFAALSWMKKMPFVGVYISDGEHGLNAAGYGLDSADIMLKAALPYADLLGLKGSGTFAGGTTEDRISKAVETLSKVTPQIDAAAEKFDLLKQELDKIDPARYPEKFADKEIRSRIVSGKEFVLLADNILKNARPMVKKLPDLLGADADGEAKYMVLFQNDKELRPTGGFITAYAIFRIEKGKIHMEASDDIYKLDDTVTKKVAPPEPIAKYLNVYSWRLRDSNFSPDFQSSMKVFEELYSSSRDKKKIDGIITLDTHVLVELMKVVGPVKIYGTSFTTNNTPECDCPMVVYELLKAAGTPRGYWVDNRKDMIGVLLSELMKKTLSAPKQLLGKLMPVVLQEVNEKHILVYLKDPDAQLGVETLGAAGQIKIAPPGSDYLHISDANLGGAKSNLYVKQKVTLNVDTNKDGTTNNLVLEYQHPHRPDNCSLERKEGLCLSGIYRDFVRVYLPAGSILVESRGFETKSATYDDLGHTVIDGFFTLTPLGVSKIQIKYNTTVKSNGPYTIVLQKQPGTVGNHYKITVDSVTKELDLVSDQQVTFNEK